MSRFDATDWLAIQTVRTLAIDAIEKANSGHPGLPLGAAPMAYVLWQRHLKHNPRNPYWPDRDRFVLSAGHGSMLLYALLHLNGYNLPLEELKRFRQWGSKTPGHPEFGHTPGVETTTGPLGQGAANAVGMAIAERKLAHLFNRPSYTLFDHFTYALVSDGDLMEGVVAEACSLAGHLRLGRLIFLYDSNDISLDGPTSMTFSTEDVGARFRAYGWHVQEVPRGNDDLDGLDQAIETAKKTLEQPSLIIVKTTIGFGSPNKQGKSSSHGSPLGTDETARTKETLKWAAKDAFAIPPEARRRFDEALLRGQTFEADWQTRLSAYRREFPDQYDAMMQAMAGELPKAWDTELRRATYAGAEATRVSSGKALQTVAKAIPWLLGGDADLGCSTNTVLKDAGSFEGVSGSGRNIHFGVREHAMGAIANGMSYHGGVRPFTATFFCFTDYMRPAIRLAALSKLNPIFVFTHDSIGLGEDGPTHQPVEHLASLRCMPGLLVLRPADARETFEAWRIAIEQKFRPTCLVFSRQSVPLLDGTKDRAATGVQRGAYVLSEASGKPSLILIATGTEVSLAVEAQKELESMGHSTRVVSMPSWELFGEQDLTYRNEVLPPNVRARVSIEAGARMGWERWVGSAGASIGVDTFGASAPAPEIYKNYGVTAAALVETAKRLINA